MVATVTAVAGTAAVLVPGIGVSAAIALGAMVAPPDPVAVEAVAGSVRMPRRLLAVLQSEGLFNDATALVVFQTAVLATVQGGTVSAPTLVLRFVLGVVGAVGIGVWGWRSSPGGSPRGLPTRRGAARSRSCCRSRSTSWPTRSARRVWSRSSCWRCSSARRAADEAAERLVQRSFWDVVELLVTGVAFGLMGLDLRQVVEAAGTDLPRTLRDAVVVCAVVVAVRVLWMLVAWWLASRSDDPERAPRTGRETVVLSWCGMRGLATLALALSLPTATAAGEAFPQRAEIVLIAVVVLVVTLVLPGFTLPFLVQRLGVATDADAEHAAEQAIVHRARAAATAVLTADDRVDRLPAGVGTNLRQRMDRLDGLLRGDPTSTEDRERAETVRRYREVMSAVQAEALAAARAEVLAARREPGVDPEAADRVLRRLDLRTVILD